MCERARADSRTANGGGAWGCSAPSPVAAHARPGRARRWYAEGATPYLSAAESAKYPAGTEYKFTPPADVGAYASALPAKGMLKDTVPVDAKMYAGKLGKAEPKKAEKKAEPKKAEPKKAEKKAEPEKKAATKSKGKSKKKKKKK